MNFRFFIKLFIIIFCMSFVSNVVAYETTKATKIVANPNDYKGKKVLVYIKFNKIKREGVFDDFLVKDIEYHYDIKDESTSEIVDKAKQRDLLTIKGEVFLVGFSPNIRVEGIVKGWIDTTLLPPCPDEIEIKCPVCNSVLIYNTKTRKVKTKEIITPEEIERPKPKPEPVKEEEEKYLPKYIIE